jgi:hypothetical protein
MSTVLLRVNSIGQTAVIISAKVGAGVVRGCNLSNCLKEAEVACRIFLTRLLALIEVWT